MEDNNDSSYTFFNPEREGNLIKRGRDLFLFLIFFLEESLY